MGRNDFEPLTEIPVSSLTFIAHGCNSNGRSTLYSKQKYHNTILNELHFVAASASADLTTSAALSIAAAIVVMVVISNDDDHGFNMTCSGNKRLLLKQVVEHQRGDEDV